MNNLRFYFAVLSTLLALFTTSIAIYLNHFMHGVPITMALFEWIIPVGAVTFLLAYVIAHFLTEPLRELAQKVRDRKEGTAFVFTQRGRLQEADELADCLEELAQYANVRQKELAVREKRQGEFISDVAHELRTPLTAIRGNAEMLQDPDLPPEMHERFCATIVRESQRLTNLTKDLITLEKIQGTTAQPDQMTRINMKTIVEEVVDNLYPILTERQANVAIVGEAPDILGNPDQMKQVIQNLVENASRFIQPGGHITVELRGLKGNCVVSVRDDGCGFGDIDPKLLFDRFYRTDSSRQRGTGGTGLGLAIVKSIVEAHDGTVEAVNLSGGGACFIVAIPAV
jgi:two-component system, OmpR family, sensor kinase